MYSYSLKLRELVVNSSTLDLSQLCFWIAYYAFKHFSKIKFIMLKIMLSNKIMLSGNVKFKLRFLLTFVTFHKIHQLFDHFVKIITSFNVFMMYLIKRLLSKLWKALQNISFYVQSELYTKSLPIMLALCSILLSSYYAQNYACIIGSSLPDFSARDSVLNVSLCPGICTAFLSKT